MNAWPVVLTEGRVTLRPLEVGDHSDWRDARTRSAAWLRPWEATMPPGDTARGSTFRSMVKRMSRQAREGHGMPFAITVDGSFAGQVTVSNIVRGSAQFASVGYWIDEQFAGRGIMPLAVAMVIDHCFFTAKLHRIEISIRPENANSLRVVEKLGINETGYAPKYLHIDGAWRDHRQFAITVEECPRGLVARLKSTRP